MSYFDDINDRKKFEMNRADWKEDFFRSRRSRSEVVWTESKKERVCAREKERERKKKKKIEREREKRIKIKKKE